MRFSLLVCAPNASTGGGVGVIANRAGRPRPAPWTRPSTAVDPSARHCANYAVAYWCRAWWRGPTSSYGRMGRMAAS